MTSGGMTFGEWSAMQEAARRANTCRRCRVLPATMVCPKDMCRGCWDVWFNGGHIPGRKRHPGRWSDATRVRRSVRLHKAAQRRQNHEVLVWLGSLKANRAARRRKAREALVRQATGLGIKPKRGENNHDLRARVLARMRGSCSR
jgi:hypothetical protein